MGGGRSTHSAILTGHFCFRWFLNTSLAYTGRGCVLNDSYRHIKLGIDMRTNGHFTMLSHWDPILPGLRPNISLSHIILGPEASGTLCALLLVTRCFIRKLCSIRRHPGIYIRSRLSTGPFRSRREECGWVQSEENLISLILFKACNKSQSGSEAYQESDVENSYKSLVGLISQLLAWEWSVLASRLYRPKN